MDLADNTLDSLERESITEKVVDALRRSILSNELKPGIRLVERELSQKLGVSRAPIREAFRILEPEGLVNRSQKGGAFVTSPSADDLDEIFTLRSVLESMAMRLAAKRITKDQLDQLRMIVEKMEDAAERDDINAYMEVDLDLHHLIWDYSGHKRLSNMLLTMEGPIRMFFLMHTQVHLPLMEATKGHKKLISALAMKDSDRAERIMAEHIEASGKATVDFLRKRESMFPEMY